MEAASQHPIIGHALVDLLVAPVVAAAIWTFVVSSALASWLDRRRDVAERSDRDSRFLLTSCVGTFAVIWIVIAAKIV